MTLRRRDAPVLAVIAAGGMVGAAARFGLAEAVAHDPAQLPWSTLAANVSGCLLIGVLMVLVTETLTVHRLVRPFLGVGVLGGYTTFSTYAVDSVLLVDAGRTATALGYVLGTVLAALLAVQLGAGGTRAGVRAVERSARRRREARWSDRPVTRRQRDDEGAAG